MKHALVRDGLCQLAHCFSHPCSPPSGVKPLFRELAPSKPLNFAGYIAISRTIKISAGPMRNITVGLTTVTCYPARIWAAKHMASASRMVAKTAWQISKQTPPAPLPLFFNPGCETVDPSHINNLRPQFHSFTVPQFLEPAALALPARESSRRQIRLGHLL